MQVTIAVLYWHKNTPDQIKRNPIDIADTIPASNGSHRFYDDTVNGEYEITLQVYENGIPNPFIQEEPKAIIEHHDASKSLSKFSLDVFVLN